MDWWQSLLLIAVGVIAGFVNTLAGGGSLLVLPTLVYAGLDGAVANGTNRVAVIAQSVSSVTGFFRKGYSDLRTSMTLSLCALPGAIVGAYLGTKIDGDLFNMVLGGLMLCLIPIMGIKSKQPVPNAQPKHPVLGHLLMVAVGFYGGVIQAGVGFFIMATLNRVMGFDLVRVNMHKVFITGFYTIVALAVFAINGQVIWMTGAVLAIGNAAGGWMGAHFAVKKGERAIRNILNIVLVVMALDLLFNR